MFVFKNYKILVLSAVSFCLATFSAMANDFSNQLKIADNKVILQQYKEAENIYQDIISNSKSAVVTAYAHYKLGALYKSQNRVEMAKTEYKKGLSSLKKAGQSNHKIANYLSLELKKSNL